MGDHTFIRTKKLLNTNQVKDYLVDLDGMLRFKDKIFVFHMSVLEEGHKYILYLLEKRSLISQIKSGVN